MAVTLYVAADFPGYARGQTISDPVVAASILAGPYSDQVRQVITTTSGSAGQNSISGVPITIQVNAAIAGTYTASAASEYVCVRLAGVDILPRIALSGLSGSLPRLVSPSAGVGTIAMYATATGGVPLFETGAITFTTGAVTGVVLPANALLIGTDAVGNPQNITLGAGLAIVDGKLTLTGASSSGGATTMVASDDSLGLLLGIPGLAVGGDSSPGSSSGSTLPSTPSNPASPDTTLALADDAGSLLTDDAGNLLIAA